MCTRRKAVQDCVPQKAWRGTKLPLFTLFCPSRIKGNGFIISLISLASLLTKDENFHIIVVDFESQDISISQAFDTDLLRNRHTIINMTGKFYKTLALNKAVEHVPSEHDLLFLFDLHIDVPADIMDSIRKVRLNIHFNPNHNSELQSATENTSQRQSALDNNIKTIQR